MAIRKAAGSAAAPAQIAAPASPSKALLAYNALRGLLLVACLGLGYVVGLRGAVLVVVALAVSGILSWFLLKKQRIRMGMAVEQAVGRGRTKLAARTEAEDEYADTLLAQQAVADDQSRS